MVSSGEKAESMIAWDQAGVCGAMRRRGAHMRAHRRAGVLVSRSAAPAARSAPAPPPEKLSLRGVVPPARVELDDARLDMRAVRQTRFGREARSRCNPARGASASKKL